MKQAIIKSAKSLWQATPILLSILLLIGVINSFLTKDVYAKIFGHGTFLDPIIGAIFGSISGGAPVNSYVLGGEFLKNGVSLTAVTAFIVTWVSVGFIQLPVEGKILGFRFAIWRNITAFILAIVIALLTNFFMTI